MIQSIIAVGLAQCNCIILSCEKSREAVVVDPGGDADRILDEVKRLQLVVKHILHTHAHFDHIGATEEIKAATGAPTYLHSNEEELLRMAPLQGQLFGLTLPMPAPMDKALEDAQLISFGTHQLQVLSTPGHSPGGVSFKLLTGPKAVLSGDTLFKLGIGRTDLWGGNLDQLLNSIGEKLLVFDDDTQVWPGHGPVTRIGDEKKHNPFIK